MEEKLKEAKRLYKIANADQRYVLESLFPELAESKDERIRKAILELVKQSSAILDKQNQNNMIAWLEGQKTSEEALQYLKENHSPSEVSDFQAAMNIAVAKAYDKGIKDGLEKQGEKPIGIRSRHATGKLGEIIKDIESSDKVEQKFKVGDWIVRDGKTLQISHIDKVLDGTFHYWFTKGTWLSSAEMEDAHLWTINDARDGDVLAEDSCIFIIEKMNPNGTARVHCCLFDDGEFDLTGSTLGFNVDSTHPATKEQRDTFFAKMKESGYEWNAEKKKPKKIEQKPAWSEEDEKILNEIFSVAARASLRKYSLFGKSYDYIKWQNWLKSLRGRVGCEANCTTMWKPSDEQIEALIWQVSNTYQGSWQYKASKELLEQLKKLRDK